MIDLKKFLNNQKDFLTRLNSRGDDFTEKITAILALYQEKHQLMINLENVAHQINLQNKKTPANTPDWENHLKIRKTHKQILDNLTLIYNEIDYLLQKELTNIPNIPHPSVPLGKDSQDNPVIFTSSHTLSSAKTPHWEIAQKLNWVNWEKGASTVQARFVIYQNEGARFLRLLQNFCLDFHLQNGYQEILSPSLIKEFAMYGTGQIPKMQKDCYKIEKEDLYLLPTGEVSLVNFVQKQLFTPPTLPQKLTTYSSCFRKEAGAAGKETRGLIRLHEFHKVEIVRIAHPDHSDQDLEEMLKEVCNLLELFGLPYRIVSLCTGDLGFVASKTYDVEVWMPSQQKYVEISSISNTETFQARKLQIKTTDKTGKKVFAHTLNGSGLALDRLFACLLETYYDQKTKQCLWPQKVQEYFTKFTMNF